MADAEPRTRVRRVSTRYARTSTYGWGWGTSWTGVIRAAAEAAATFIVGGSRVVGNLILDSADSFVGPSDAAAADYDDEPLQTTIETEVAVGAAPGAPATMLEEEEEIDLVAPSFCGSLTRAFRDASLVVSRSADRFAIALEEEQGRSRLVRTVRVQRRVARVQGPPPASPPPASVPPTSPPPAGSPPPGAMPGPKL